MSLALIADSNQRDRERVRDTLAELDIECRLCENSEQARRVKTGTYRIAFVSWEMPAGPELVSRLHEANTAIPIIAMVNSLDASRANKATSMGASGFVMKPLNRDDLHKAVQAGLQTEPDPPLLKRLIELDYLIGSSPKFNGSLRRLARVIESPKEPILLVGEPGTGKELFAQAIHDLGQWHKHPSIRLNMAGFSRDLVESALFGHVAGAYTGATKARLGAFEEVGEGTLLLDEIGEFDLDLQAKLLRAVEGGGFQRVGSNTNQLFQGRLICATNRNLVAAVAQGHFRSDLYDRISVHEIRTVPLRERDGDLWKLTPHFLKSHGEKNRPLRLSRPAKQILAQYPFYGNVRELENIIKWAAAQADGDEIHPQDLPLAIMDEKITAHNMASNDIEFNWPRRLHDQTYDEALREIETAFAKEYLPDVLDRANQRKGEATTKAGFKDPKTFKAKWEAAGLPPWNSKE